MKSPMKRTAWSVLGNSQRLDGGAMFGNAPRAMWEKWAPPDELNRIALACRALLVREEDGERTRHVLFETGIGAFFPPKLRDRYGVQESGHVLLDGLAHVGVSDTDIDVVVLSHMHFDHAGGLLASFEEGAPPRLLFPNATYVVGRRAFERALHPHRRDRASFIPELTGLLEASGRLELVDTPAPGGAGAPSFARSVALGSEVRFHFSDGHTPGLMLAELPSEEGPVLFAADLIPGRPWVHLPITMGYDRFPETLVDEKERLLSDLVARDGRLFFTHDSAVAMSVVTRDDKGKYAAGRSWDVLDALPL